MTSIIIILSGIFGLIIGSFINVLTIRFDPEKKQKFFKITSGRSHCPNCQKQLRWFELIPLFSFIFQLGKCLSCRKRISWQYPIVELMTGIIFAGITWKIFSLEFFKYFIFSGAISSILMSGILFFWLLFATILIILSVIDYKHYILPEKIIFFSWVVSILFVGYLFLLEKLELLFGGINFLGSLSYIINLSDNLLINHLLGAVVFSGFLYIVYLITMGRAMGFGDVMLAISLGLMLGWASSIMSLGLSFVIGAIVAIISLSLKKKKFGQYLPFAPFLAAGVVGTIFFGEMIITAYLSIII